MLGQKKVTNSLDDERILNIGELIEFFESSIDDSLQLYLIIWSPDPKEMPDADFYLQHNVNIDMLKAFLLNVHLGMFTVESSQLGRPHYHGWYQVDLDLELGRIAAVKTMNRFGDVKIAKCRSYKINNYSERKNGLYYYKKDVYGAMGLVDPNPIVASSSSTINFDNIDLVGFFSKDKGGMMTIKEKISDRQFYRDYYKDTIGFIS